MPKTDHNVPPAIPAFLRYGLSVILVGISLSVTLLFQGYTFRTPLFFPAVILSTWFGGTGPGLLAHVAEAKPERPWFAIGGISLGRLDDVLAAAASEARAYLAEIDDQPVKPAGAEEALPPPAMPPSTPSWAEPPVPVSDSPNPPPAYMRTATRR